MLEKGSNLAFLDPIWGHHHAALTSNSVANLGEIEPACSWYSWVPSPLDWHALYYDSNTGDNRDEKWWSQCKFR